MIAVSFGEKTNRDPYRAALRSAEIDFIENPPALEALNGLMLTGGTDVDPAFYGESRHPETDPPDIERDQRERTLLLDALDRDIPILAICRGMQLLNVVLGGTLKQHIENHRVRGQLNAHDVNIGARTKLASILQPGAYAVNSRHHQCVQRLGEGLIVSAKAGEVVEALELPGKHFVIAVQWHPEDRSDGTDRKLFQAFAEAIHNVTSTAPA